MTDANTDPQQAPTLDYILQQLQALSDEIHNHKHTGYDMSAQLNNTSFSGGSIINSTTLGNANTSGQLTLQVADGQGDTFIKAGTIADGDFANAGAGTGFILGIDDTDANKAKFFFGNASSYMKYDGTTFTVVGGVSVSKLDIPDTTTANSFHTDTSGNSWWGANVASGFGNATASISAAGNATFKSVSIGGNAVQYVITNSGIFSYGDGSDGAGVADGSTALAGATLAGSTYTLTRDVYYTDLTTSTGVTILPSGWRIFGTGTLTMNGTATISRNGNNGSAAGNIGGGGGNVARTPGGAALSDGYLKGVPAGGDGGGSSGGVQSAALPGVGVTNSIGVSGVGGGNQPGLKTDGGVATQSNVKLIANWHLATLLDIASSGSTVKFTGSASSSGGESGSVSGSSAGSGGGGGSGGVLVVVYNQMANSGNNTTTGLLANGGLGGAAGNASGFSGGGGGGGGASPGGTVAIYFRNIVIGANSIISVNGGVGGKGGDSVSTASATAGSNGNPGKIYSFQLSL